MGIQVAWNLPSLYLYIFLGLLSIWMIHHIKERESRTGKPICWNNKHLIVTSLIWSFFATFRLVTNNGIGGTDAPNYIMFFEQCNNKVYTGWMLHVGDDFIFKWINKIIRYFTSNYHVYFAIVYGFMAWAYLWFVSRFTPRKTSIMPYILCYFLFWRSMNTLRSNLAIAFIMVACVFLLDKKNRKAYLFAFLAALIHKAALLYALVIPMILIFKKYNLKVWHIICLIVASFFAGEIFQGFFIQYTQEVDLQGAYGSYASKSIEGGGFLENAWKIAFEQIILGFFFFFYYNKIEKLKTTESELDSNRIKIISLICAYDLILIPINYLLSIWRGYEFFYMPRIVMWGIISYFIINKVPKIKYIISTLVLITFISWYIFRIQRMFELSGLMPYIFEPILYL